MACSILQYDDVFLKQKCKQNLGSAAFFRGQICDWFRINMDVKSIWTQLTSPRFFFFAGQERGDKSGGGKSRFPTFKLAHWSRWTSGDAYESQVQPLHPLPSLGSPNPILLSLQLKVLPRKDAAVDRDHDPESSQKFSTCPSYPSDYGSKLRRAQ